MCNVYSMSTLELQLHNVQCVQYEYIGNVQCVLVHCYPNCAMCNACKYIATSTAQCAMFVSTLQLQLRGSVQCVLIHMQL
jgi:hypothetical protein